MTTNLEWTFGNWTIGMTRLAACFTIAAVVLVLWAVFVKIKKAVVPKQQLDKALLAGAQALEAATVSMHNDARRIADLEREIALERADKRGAVINLAVAVEALRKIASTRVQTKTGKWYMDRAHEALAKIEGGKA